MPATPTLLVSDIMISKVYRVTPDMKLREIAEMMIKHQISGAPVVDQLDNVLTMIGEGDLLRLAASDGLETTVSHCLSKLPPTAALLTLQKHQSFTDAYRLFLKHKLHRLPVVDANGRLMGIITRSTILVLFVEAHYGKKIPKRNN